MGRTIIERPLREIADFLEEPASALFYDKHIMVGSYVGSSGLIPATIDNIEIYAAAFKILYHLRNQNILRFCQSLKRKGMLLVSS